MYLYRPQTKLREGNVFHLSVILFTGGVCIPWADPRPRQTPPRPRRQLKRAVRILLECILVCIFFHTVVSWTVVLTELFTGKYYLLSDSRDEIPAATIHRRHRSLLLLVVLTLQNKTTYRLQQ